MKQLIYIVTRQKFYYYTTNIFKLLIPHFIYRSFLNYWLNKIKDYPQKELDARIKYYVNPTPKESIENGVVLKNFIKPKGDSQYFFDLAQITKYFAKQYRIKYLFGDVTENQLSPTIVKSRPINHSGNSVVMKLDALRHFNFFEDTIPFEKKKNKAVWRGEIHKENRRLLVEKYYNHPLCNIGEVSKHPHKKEWIKNFLSIKEQLAYKFVISIEGIDVATNLKWILNSNSLCFMPKPKFETWFMEGKLIPNYHYILLDDDYNNLIEKINFYTQNPKEAKKIIQNANRWTAQFKNKKLEKTLSITVLNEYLKKTKQKN